MADSVEYNTLKPYWYITYIFEIVKNIFFAISIIMLSNLNSDSIDKKSAEIPNLDMI
jgi:hypothetical protein